MSVILPCTCKDDIIIICNNKKAITEHDPFNKITAQIFIFNWSKTGLKWPPQSRPHTKNTSIFKVLFAYHPCTGKCSVTYVTSPVPFLCSSFSLCGISLSHRKNTEMDRASTGHSSFPYSVCFIKV